MPIYKKAAEKILEGQFAINPYTENGILSHTSSNTKPSQVLKQLPLGTSSFPWEIRVVWRQTLRNSLLGLEIREELNRWSSISFNWGRNSKTAKAEASSSKEQKKQPSKSKHLYRRAKYPCFSVRCSGKTLSWQSVFLTKASTWWKSANSLSRPYRQGCWRAHETKLRLAA